MRRNSSFYLQYLSVKAITLHYDILLVKKKRGFDLEYLSYLNLSILLIIIIINYEGFPLDKKKETQIKVPIGFSFPCDFRNPLQRNDIIGSIILNTLL